MTLTPSYSPRGMASTPRHLPNETLDEILRLAIFEPDRALHTFWGQERLNYMLVNHKFYHLTQEAVKRNFSRLILEVSFNQKPGCSSTAWTLEKTFDWLAKHGQLASQVKELRFIAVLQHEDHTSLRANPVAAVALLLPRLQDLHIYSIGYDAFQASFLAAGQGAFSSLPPSIRSLHLSMTCITPQHLARDLAHLDQLETIVLDDVSDLGAMVDHRLQLRQPLLLPQVKILRYYAPTHWNTPTRLSELFQIFPNVASLSLFEMTGAKKDTEGLVLPKSLSKLKIGLRGHYQCQMQFMLKQITDCVTPEQLAALRYFEVIDQGLRVAPYVFGNCVYKANELYAAMSQVQKIHVALDWKEKTQNYTVASNAMIAGFERAKKRKSKPLSKTITLTVDGKFSTLSLEAHIAEEAERIRGMTWLDIPTFLSTKTYLP